MKHLGGQLINQEITLGLSYGYHDSAAAIVIDGKLMAAIQEERLTRQKADHSFPENAIKEVLKILNLELQDVTSVVFYEKPMLKFERMLKDVSENYPKSFLFFRDSMIEWIGKNKLDFFKYSVKQIKDENFRKDFIQLIAQIGFKYSHHHLSHAASAHFLSGHASSAVLVADAVGEYSSTSIWIADGSNLRMIKEYQFPHSIGVLYSIITAFIGFKPNSGEYKVMGLAPFGKPVYLEKFRELFSWQESATSEFPETKLNTEIINPIWSQKENIKSLEKFFGKKSRQAETPIEEFYADIAASLQKLTNDYLVNLSEKIFLLTREKNIVMAGGVALNCVSNEEIRLNTSFENIFIQPAAGDAGGAVGAAFAYQASIGVPLTNETQRTTYLGSEFSNNEINQILVEQGIFVQFLSNSELIQLASQDLVEHKIIGWFQGKSEFGPRALGNRSILGRPDSKDMQKRMNLKIKFRESFRPFAPIVITEKFSEYFHGVPDPFMIRLAKVNDFKTIENRKFEISVMLETPRSLLQAVTHLDGTARVQSLVREQNQLLYDLIIKFSIKSGVPVLINTSFNTRGEPIVNSPYDALVAFARTEIDTLYIGNYRITRDNLSNKLITTAREVTFNND